MTSQPTDFCDGNSSSSIRSNCCDNSSVFPVSLYVYGVSVIESLYTYKETGNTIVLKMFDPVLQSYDGLLSDAVLEMALSSLYLAPGVLQADSVGLVCLNTSQPDTVAGCCLAP